MFPLHRQSHREIFVTGSVITGHTISLTGGLILELGVRYHNFSIYNVELK